MLYEKYHQKVLKWSRILTAIYRFRVLIISVSLATVALLATFMGVYGMVYDSGECPAEITYGEQFNYEAKSLFTSVSYEYCAVDGGEWTSTYPQEVGDYLVRSVSVSIFGSRRYGTEYAFTILPKELSVYVGVNSVTYGELPEVVADNLVSSDSVRCTRVIYGDVTAAETSVIPDKDSVTIVNADGEDITDNYSFTCAETQITFNKRDIEISVSDAQKVYDGTALSSEEHTVTGGSLAEGDAITVVKTADITRVGQVENQIEVAIYNGDGKEVTSNYKITVNAGTLTVTSRDVYVSTKSASFGYDGGGHSLAEYEIAESTENDGLLSGHKVSGISYFASVTAAGEYDNEIELKIAAADGTDVTANYNIIYDYGTLTVTAREITVQTFDDAKVYDGAALYNVTYRITAGTLAAGQTSDIVSYAQITAVGETENAVVLNIYDGQTDVTANYDITYIYGALAVAARKITVETGSFEKVYDGTALYNFDYTVTEGGIADGQTAKVESYAQITNVGEVENAVVLGIYGGQSDVTANYEIIYKYGALTVTAREITVKTFDNQKVYDGEALYNYDYEISGGGIADGQICEVESYAQITSVGEVENAVVLGIYGGQSDVTANYEIIYKYGTLTVTAREITVTAESAEKVYDGTALVCADYAAENVVEGQTLTAQTSGSQLTVGTSANVIVDGSVTITDGDGNETTDNYVITYIDGALTVTPRPVTVTAGSDAKVYDGTALVCADYVAENVVEGQTLTAQISGSQLNVGTSANVIEGGSVVIRDGGNETTANYEITCIDGALTVTPREITVKTLDDTKVYDGTALYNYTYEITYGTLADGQSESVISYAQITNAGDITNEVILQIRDKSGCDVTYNYNITYNYGTLTITPRPITITAGSDTKVYDGTALTCADYTAENVVEGQTLTAQTSGSQLNVGTSANVIADGSVYICDSNGGDTTFNYEITYIDGTLTVTPRPITVKTYNGDRVYDGTALINYVYTITSGTLVNGHSSDVASYVQITNVGSIQNEIKIVVYDTDSRDVTANYEITYIYGTLTITAREITVTAGSDEKVYDGTALTCGNCLGDNLAEGQTVAATTSGSQLTVGTSENVIIEGSVVIKDCDGNETTSNYIITLAGGTLTVTPRPITVTAGSAEKIYDGTPLTCGDCSGDNLAEGQTVTATTSGSQLTVGTSDNIIVGGSVVIKDSGGNETTSNYTITLADGTLTVTPRPITITTGSDEKVYDGAELICADYSAENVVEGQTLTAQTNGSQLNAGTSYNTIADGSVYISDANGNETTGNYEITYINGTLTVTPREITVKTYDDSKTYDGKPLYNYTYEIAVGSLVSGQSESVESYAQITNVGETENAVVLGIYEGETNVTANYNITYEYGTLTVTARAITIASNSHTWLYEGLTHYETGYTITSGELADGQTLSLKTVGIKEVGTAKNTFTATITDANGDKVTENYIITCEYGTLTVFSPLTLEVGDYYEFIAEAKGNFTFTLISGGVTIKVSEEVSKTLSQEDDYYTVALEAGDSVTITANTASELTVLCETDPDSGDTGGDSGGGSGGGLDTSGNISGGETTEGDGYFMKITSDTTGELYLKLISYGDYTGSGWSSATEYTDYIYINGTQYSLNYLFSIALAEAGYTASTITVELNVDDYVLPYYMALGGDGYEIQISDVYYSGSTVTYTLNVYYYNYTENGGSGLSLSEEEYKLIEQAYSEYVYANYLSVPEDTLTYLKTIIEAQGFTATDSDIIAKVAEYIQNAATYNLKYDRTLDSETDIVVAFLRDYQEGICQHYASAATLLYRALGIPARYVLGYYATTTAGETVETGVAHAWVEVYISGLGWVQVEVTGSGFADGSGSGSGSGSGGSGSGSGGSGGSGGADTIIIKPVDEIKTYDGTALTAVSVEGGTDEYTYLLKELLYLGYTYEVVFGGSQTETGESASTITSFILYNPDGSVCNNYTFEFEEGTLTVTDKTVITVYLYDYSKVYDGTALAYGEDDYYWLESDYTVKVEGLSSISLTNYGIVTESMLNALTITVYNLSGADVTSNVYIKIDTTDVLTIYRRCITVTSASASKVYDGTELTDSDYWISFGTLADGDEIAVTVTGSIYAVGKTDNVISEIVITDGNGGDVTDNYLITEDEGTLTIVKE